MNNSWVKNEETQKQLIIYLKELATCNEEEFNKIAERIYNLYVDNKDYRHRYSDFLPLILEVAKCDDGKDYDTEKIDPFAENLNNFLQFVKSKEDVQDDVFRSVFKLTDHINLEIGRFKESLSKEDKIKILENYNKETTKRLENAKIKLEAASRKLNSVQTELIAVLSIFAAIVLTFSGSLNLIGNALSNIENAPFGKAVFFIALCGFIVLNIIFLMMYIVGKITNSNIYARCETENCTCGENNMPKCNGINRVKKRLPYVFWTNVILLTIIIIGFILIIIQFLISKII